MTTHKPGSSTKAFYLRLSTAMSISGAHFHLNMLHNLEVYCFHKLHLILSPFRGTPNYIFTNEHHNFRLHASCLCLFPHFKLLPQTKVENRFPAYLFLKKLLVWCINCVSVFCSRFYLALRQLLVQVSRGWALRLDLFCRLRITLNWIV